MLDDRQAETAAADAAGAAAAIEAVEHSLAVLDRNARPAIAHAEHDAARVIGERDIDSAAGGSVANRIVDQIRDQRAQRIRTTLDHRRSSGGEPEIDALGTGERRQVGDDFARQRRQIHRCRRHFAHSRFLACQRQELLDQARRTLETALELAERRRALGVGGRALGELRLQMHRGERCAQLVRGVGDKRALRVERMGEAREQIVERADQRLNFARQIGLGQWLQQRRRTPRHRGRDPIERLQPSGNGEPDQDGEKRQHRQERHDGSQCHARRELAPRAHRLRDLHHLFSGERAEHPPRPALGGERREPELRVLGQNAARLRQEKLHAVAIPDLHHHGVAAGANGACPCRDCRKRCVGQRRGHFLELIVEQRIGFVARAPIGAYRSGRDRQRDAEQQPDQQLAPDRSHDVA